MMDDIFVDKMTKKHKAMLSKKMRRLAAKVSDVKPRSRKSIKVALFFSLCKLQHKMVLNTEAQPSLDNRHYIDNSWIKP